MFGLLDWLIPLELSDQFPYGLAQRRSRDRYGRKWRLNQ